jgi:hypothetical protein
MFCKVCNTRVGPGSSTCPNCGSHSVSASPGSDRDSATKLPLPGLKGDARHERREEAAAVAPIYPAEVEVELDEPAEMEVELDGPAEVELNEPAEVGASAPVRRARSTAPEEKDDPPPATLASRVRRSDPLGIPDPMGLRAMLVDQPELLEPGLSVYVNEKGTPLGASYTSAVGEIDLLARSADGGLVVVMVAEPHEGEELIAGVLQRIGWVGKHLSGREEPVRGIVLLDHARDDIAYAAVAVAGTVKFKTYRVALRFDDLEF